MTFHREGPEYIYPLDPCASTHTFRIPKATFITVAPWVKPLLENRMPSSMYIIMTSCILASKNILLNPILFYTIFLSYYSNLNYRPSEYLFGLNIIYKWSLK